MSSRPRRRARVQGGSRRRGKRADGDEVKAESEESEGPRRRGLCSAGPAPDRICHGAGRSDGSGLPAVAADAAESAGLRVRPKAVRPPRTLVFVEDGAQVKRVLSVFEAVVAATGKSE